MVKYIFYNADGLKLSESDISKYISKDFKMINKNELEKTKKLYWVFYSQNFKNNYKHLVKHLSTIPINILSYVNYPKQNIFDKYYLHKIIKKECKQFYNNFFLDLIKIDEPKTITEFMNNNKIIIIKPEPGYGGYGIRVFRKPNSAINYIYKKQFNKNVKEHFNKYPPKKWLIQKYMDNPLLLNNKKFHLRVMVLIIRKSNKTDSYLYSKFQPIIAVKEYQLNSLNKNIHNTHAKVLTKNKLLKSYQYYDQLDKDKKDLIKKQILYICEILNKYIKFKCWKENKCCFRYIGYDFMVTDKYKVKIIEANKEPGFHGFFSSFWKGMIDLTLYQKKKALDYIKMK